MISSRTFLPWLLSGALLAASVPVPLSAAAQDAVGGHISGVARTPAGQPLGAHTARLRDVNTGQLVGNATTDATGQFSFAGLTPGDYLVEIVDAGGQMVGVTSPISLTIAAMTASGVTVTAAAGTVAAVTTGGGLASFFSSTAVITAAAVAGGVTAAVVSTRATASPSR